MRGNKETVEMLTRSKEFQNLIVMAPKMGLDDGDILLFR